MKLGADTCPDCGNLYSFVSGGSVGIACKLHGCEVGYTTSNLPAFTSDIADYTCYVNRLPEDWRPAVVWSANRLNIPTVEARNYRYDSSIPLFTKKASEVFYLRREFREHGIELRIEPKFDYTEDDIEPDGKRPLSSAELQVVSELIDIEKTPEI